MVTGGSGFIGSNLVEYLLEAYPEYDVLNVSKHTYAMNPKTLEHLESNKHYKFVALDITDELAFYNLLFAWNVEQIFHLAAETHVDRSFLYPKDFLTANLIGTFSILEVLRKIPKTMRPRLLYMSTDEVFGDVPHPIKCKENDALAPRNPYSVTKAAAEMYVNAYHHSFGLDTVVARSMNNFGPRQHPEKLIGKIITRCLTDTSFTLFKGGAIRGWIFVEDTCSALKTIMERGRLGEIYHIPPTQYLTVPAVANRILKLMDKTHLWKGFEGSRLKDDERYALDCSKMTEQLGWMPTYSFDDGLLATIKWFEENQWFWRHVESP